MATAVRFRASEAFAFRRRGVVQPVGFFFLSILIGVGGGLGAVVFRGLIALFHNLCFRGVWSLSYDANVHTAPAPWGAWIIGIPVAGSVLVTFLVKNFAPEAKGHGVPEVIDAIYYREGVVRPVVAAVKSLASALSIGSGGSVGREGPIIQIGSALGSWLGQVMRMPPWQRITLMAAGAGAGIAATFNTPIGGVLFATEIVLNEVSAKTLVPVAISTATASFVGRLVFGPNPSFVIPELASRSFQGDPPAVLGACLVLGILTGLASVVFIRAIYAFENVFENRIENQYLRHASGMLLVGVTLYLLLRTTGHYYVGGVGYATIQDVVDGQGPVVWLLIVLLVLKLGTTSLTLGSGGSGGVFSPSLFIGATLGAAFGALFTHVAPHTAMLSPAAAPLAFALCGMAGMVGGSTGAAVTAVVMTFEMTMDYHVVIPMTLTVAVSFGVRKILCPQSIYTMKLFRRGHDVPDALQAEVYFIRHARDVMDKHVAVVPASSTLDEVARLQTGRPDVSHFVVADQEHLVGLLSVAAILSAVEAKAEPPPLAGALANRSFDVVPESAMLSEVIGRIRSANVAELLVAPSREAARADEILGVITPREVGEAFIDASGLFWLESP